MLDSIMIGFVVGVGGTGLGSLIAILLGKRKILNSALFPLTAGIMLSVVCFELLPESIEMIGVLGASLFVMAGALLMNLLESIFSSKKNEKKLFMIALAIAFHNFPEGLILGVSGQLFGALTLLIALHDIPEGIAVALPYVQNGKWAKGLFYSILSGIPTVIGALIGGLFSSVSIVVSGACLAFGGGAMIYVVFSELIPHSNNLLKDKISGIILTIGVIIGLIVIYLV